MGIDVGCDVGSDVGCVDGMDVGFDVGCDVGMGVGIDVGCDEGIDVGNDVVCDVGIDVGCKVGFDSLRETWDFIGRLFCIPEGQVVGERLMHFFIPADVGTCVQLRVIFCMAFLFRGLFTGCALFIDFSFDA